MGAVVHGACLLASTLPLPPAVMSRRSHNFRMIPTLEYRDAWRATEQRRGGQRERERDVSRNQTSVLGYTSGGSRLQHARIVWSLPGKGPTQQGCKEYYKIGHLSRKQNDNINVATASSLDILQIGISHNYSLASNCSRFACSLLLSLSSSLCPSPSLSLPVPRFGPLPHSHSGDGSTLWNGNLMVCVCVKGHPAMYLLDQVLIVVSNEPPYSACVWWVCVCVCICVHVCACVRASACTFICAGVRVNVYVNTYARVYMYVCIFVMSYTYACACICNMQVCV